MSKVKLLIDFVLNTAASLKGAGIHMVRIAIFIIFVWMGGLKWKVSFLSLQTVLS